MNKPRSAARHAATCFAGAKAKTILLLCALALQMLAACQSQATMHHASATQPAAGGEQPSQASPEAQGWALAFTDDFDREELGENWQPLEGAWKIQDGCLVGAGALISTQGFPGTHPGGFIRMAFDATPVIDAKPLFPGATPIVEVSDLSAVIHAQPLEPGSPLWNTGYFFQFGGAMNTVNRILRQGHEITRGHPEDPHIQPGQTHHIVVENNQGALRLYVDGRRLLEHDDPFAIVGKGYDRVGLYFFTKAKVDRVRIYIKRLPDDEI